MIIITKEVGTGLRVLNSTSEEKDKDRGSDLLAALDGLIAAACQNAVDGRINEVLSRISISLKELEELKSAILGKVFIAQPASKPDKLFSEIADVHDFVFGKKTRPIVNVCRKVANQKSTILLTGETGTGKSKLARFIHSLSNRAAKPFIIVDCTSLPASLVESELFGYKKGSFTSALADKKGLVEKANGGTLFLDEIGEMPLSLQCKLLRLLSEGTFQPIGGDERKVDVRIITATNRNLKEMVDNNEFRKDLYYRLDVISINLPPLRERPDEIPELAAGILNNLSGGTASLSEEALGYLLERKWEGNIRELANYLEKAFYLSDGGKIELADLEQQEEQIFREDQQSDSFEEMFKLFLEAHEGKAMQEYEKYLLLAALKKTKGSQVKAARILGITKRIISYKIHEIYKIPQEFFDNL